MAKIREIENGEAEFAFFICQIRHFAMPPPPIPLQLSWIPLQIERPNEELPSEKLSTKVSHVLLQLLSYVHLHNMHLIIIIVIA